MSLTPLHYVVLLPAFLTALVAFGLLFPGLVSRQRQAGILLSAFSAAMLATALRVILGRFITEPARFEFWDRLRTEQGLGRKATTELISKLLLRLLRE